MDRLPARRARGPASAGPRGSGLDDHDEHGGPVGAAAPCIDGDEEDLLTALLFESTRARREDAIRDGVAHSTPTSATALLSRPGRASGATAATGPGRGFEALRYRFEIVSDYGAFRDLQRHRMLTVQWQPLTPDLGAASPSRSSVAGCGDEYRRALERLDGGVRAPGRARPRGAAPYALCLGYRIRFVLDLNAREAMQLIELRSGREGHPSYRAVAHEMHAQIAAVHPAVAGAMTHVDRETEPRLERILSEMRSSARAGAGS